ncbi:helix-turn-helix domain-containing protein [Aeribacillus composti]|uniref:helix-turn-helix domain-containing protein n=1 Tax=Aeribacillus composti TaxID=1868734 RepID=UPI002E1F8977|nr:helix-turn-helix domain-containing protein [Aeribacillus composti]
MFLYDVVTPAEIEKMFSLPAGSVRRDIKRKLFRRSEIRKSGATWLITLREAKRVYQGYEDKIQVKKDWNWVRNYIDSELNPVLEEEIADFLDGAPFERIYELYFDAIEGIGIEDEGEYLSFVEWFYRFKESYETTEI